MFCMYNLQAQEQKKALIDGKIIGYDLMCSHMKHEGFVYLGYGKIYSIKGIRQAGRMCGHFFKNETMQGTPPIANTFHLEPLGNTSGGMRKFIGGKKPVIIPKTKNIRIDTCNTYDIGQPHNYPVYARLYFNDSDYISIMILPGLPIVTITGKSGNKVFFYAIDSTGVITISNVFYTDCLKTK